MTRQYRLVWYQHFHKAAGSSIVRLAQRNGERLYPKHGNGNPLSPDGQVIPLWRFTGNELIEFVDRCERDNISFIATEWGCPRLAPLAADPRVVLVTCLREPLERFVSNFYYDYHAGYTDCRSLENYESSGRAFTMPNYYCRTLARIDTRPEPVTEEEFETARQALACFDVRPAMTNTGFLREICRRLGWTCYDLRANQSAMRLRRIIGPLLLLKPRLLWRRLRVPRRDPDDTFAEVFRRKNIWDYRLYQECLEHQMPDIDKNRKKSK